MFCIIAKVLLIDYYVEKEMFMSALLFAVARVSGPLLSLGCWCLLPSSTHTPLPHTGDHISVSPQLPGGRQTVKMSASVSLDEAINNFKDVVTTLDITKSGTDTTF